MKNAITYLTALVFSILLTACSNPLEPVDREPLLEGMITEVSDGVVLIEEDENVSESSDKGGGKTRFRIDGDTRIFKQMPDGSLKQARIYDLKVGINAQGWGKGAEALSYPTSVRAQQIVLL